MAENQHAGLPTAWRCVFTIRKDPHDAQLHADGECPWAFIVAKDPPDAQRDTDRRHPNYIWKTKFVTLLSTHCVTHFTQSIYQNKNSSCCYQCIVVCHRRYATYLKNCTQSRWWLIREPTHRQQHNKVWFLGYDLGDDCHATILQ